MADKKKSKKGCLIRILYGFLILIVIIGAALLVFFAKGDNNVDLKFQQLINVQFEASNFTNEVDKWRADFGEKLKNCTNTPTICDDEGNIDYAVFMSDDVRVNSDIELDRFDFAIMCSQLNVLGAGMDDSLGSLVQCLSINRIEWQLFANKMQYSIIYNIDVEKFSKIISLTQKPEKMYLTVNSEIDLSVTDSVKSVTFTVNELTGESNDYCVAKLGLDVESAREKLAYLPVSYLDDISTMWNARYIFKDNYVLVK